MSELQSYASRQYLETWAKRAGVTGKITQDGNSMLINFDGVDIGILTITRIPLTEDEKRASLAEIKVLQNKYKNNLFEYIASEDYRRIPRRSKYYEEDIKIFDDIPTEVRDALAKKIEENARRELRIRNGLEKGEERKKYKVRLVRLKDKKRNQELAKQREVKKDPVVMRKLSGLVAS